MAIPAPDHLSDEAKARWADLAELFDLDNAEARLLLQTACEALDRLRDHQRELAADGTVVTDRFDQKKPHPSLVGERDARSSLLMTLRALDRHRPSGLEAWNFDPATVGADEK